MIDHIPPHDFSFKRHPPPPPHSHTPYPFLPLPIWYRPIQQPSTIHSRMHVAARQSVWSYQTTQTLLAEQRKGGGRGGRGGRGEDEQCN